ncbi:MAG: putative sugar nucleotidyl transferase [Balneola sp.]
MRIYFFDDSNARHFKPLTLTRPIWDLRIGILTIKEKWESILKPEQCYWLIDDHLKEVFPSHTPLGTEECHYINSRMLPSSELAESICKLKSGDALYSGNTLLAYRFQNFLTFDEIKTKLTPSETSFKPKILTYLWDLLEYNSHEIESDIKLVKAKSFLGNHIEHVIISKPEKVFISDSAVIEPGVIIMGDSGPVYIGDSVTLEAGSIIKGPAAICDGATVKMSARIYGASTIGPVCKVGGEVYHSIFHSFSNKAHDGFVGNSLLGQWCNMGADSNTSNLKNNYDFVRIQDWETKKMYNIGFQFFGTVMGDHSKTSINSMLSTGTTCGVSSNIFTSEFPQKYIPSFTWLDGKENPVFRFDKAVEVMKAMMARRKVELTPEYENMMRQIFEKKL